MSLLRFPLFLPTKSENVFQRYFTLYILSNYFIYLFFLVGDTINNGRLGRRSRSFLDDTLPLCNNGFLDMKNYLNPPCRAKSFALEDTTRCLDRLSYGDHSHPNQTELYQLLPTSQTPGGGRTTSENKLVHFIFVGDSTIRQHFYNLLKVNFVKKKMAITNYCPTYVSFVTLIVVLAGLRSRIRFTDRFETRKTSHGRECNEPFIKFPCLVSLGTEIFKQDE